MELIDRDALRDKIIQRTIEEDTEFPEYDWGTGLSIAKDILERMPTVDAQLVRHGKWIKLDMHEHLADHKCTACGQEFYVPTCMGEPMYTYCPNCGAKMGDKDETD